MCMNSLHMQHLPRYEGVWSARSNTAQHKTYVLLKPHLCPQHRLKWGSSLAWASAQGALPPAMDRSEIWESLIKPGIKRPHRLVPVGAEIHCKVFLQLILWEETLHPHTPPGAIGHIRDWKLQNNNASWNIGKKNKQVNYFRKDTPCREAEFLFLLGT